MNPIAFALLDAIRALVEFLYRQEQAPDSKTYPIAETFVIGDSPGVFYDFNHRAALITIDKLRADTVTLYCGSTSEFTQEIKEVNTGIFHYVMPANSIYLIAEIASQWLREAKLFYQNEGSWVAKPIGDMEEIMTQVIAARVDAEQNLPPVPPVDLYMDAITYGEMSASFVTGAREDAQRDREAAQRVLEATDRYPFDDRFPRSVEHRAAQATAWLVKAEKWYRDMEDMQVEDRVTLVKRLATVIREVYRQDKEGV